MSPNDHSECVWDLLWSIGLWVLYSCVATAHTVHMPLVYTTDKFVRHVYFTNPREIELVVDVLPTPLRPQGRRARMFTVKRRTESHKSESTSTNLSSSLLSGYGGVRRHVLSVPGEFVLHFGFRSTPSSSPSTPTSPASALSTFAEVRGSVPGRLSPGEPTALLSLSLTLK